VRLLGAGGMAQVYQARPADSPQAEACYALKILTERWASNAAAVAQFQREAKLGSTVSHPHVISVLDWRLQSAPHFLVMPFLEGSPLEAHLAGGRALPAAQAIWIARQTAEALCAISAAGWMHCDVKPANVFVSPDGHATLIDLGLARPLASPGSAAERAVVGTLDYMAPEMLTSALAADTRSDLYSLGVMLFRMLAGRLPHNGSPAAVSRALDADLPPGIAELVRQLLAHDPLRRPQDPAEVVERLLPAELATFCQRYAA
jgi:serine/threonine-protein kinase